MSEGEIQAGWDRLLTSKERTALIKEQRRLGYRILIGTTTRADRERLEEIRALLSSGFCNDVP